MKRYFCLLFCLILLLPGCENNETKIEKPVRYYYCNADVTFGNNSSVIGYEVRESVGFENNVFYLLSRYLRGPEDERFAPTFPPNTRLSTCDITETTVSLCVSNELAQLSGMELSLACAALTMTVYGITGKDIVMIRTESELLDGKQMVTYRYSELIFVDEAGKNPPATVPATTPTTYAKETT